MFDLTICWDIMNFRCSWFISIISSDIPGHHVKCGNFSTHLMNAYISGIYFIWSVLLSCNAVIASFLILELDFILSTVTGNWIHKTIFFHINIVNKPYFFFPAFYSGGHNPSDYLLVTHAYKLLVSHISSSY